MGGQVFIVRQYICGTGAARGASLSYLGEQVEAVVGDGSISL
jgi:hypothetical protein